MFQKYFAWQPAEQIEYIHETIIPAIYISLIFILVNYLIKNTIQLLINVKDLPASKLGQGNQNQIYKQAKLSLALIICKDEIVLNRYNYYKILWKI